MTYQLKFVPELRFIKVPIDILGGAKDGTSFTADITDVSEGTKVLKSEATIYFSNNTEIEDEADTALNANGQRKYTDNGVTYTDGENHRGMEFVDLSKFVRSKSEGDDKDLTTKYSGSRYEVEVDHGFSFKEHSVSARSNNMINFNGVDSVYFCSDNMGGSTSGDHCAVIVCDYDPLTRTCDWMNSSLSMDGKVWDLVNISSSHRTADFSVGGRSKNADKYIYLEVNKSGFPGSGGVEFHDYTGDTGCCMRLNLHPYQMHMVNADPVEVLRNGKVEKLNVVKTVEFVDPNKGNQSYTDDAIFYRYDSTSIRVVSNDLYGDVKLEGIYFYDEDKTNTKTNIYPVNGTSFTLTPEMLQKYPNVFNAKRICIKPVVSLSKTNVIFDEYNDADTGISVKAVKNGDQITALDMYKDGKKLQTITWSKSSFGSTTSFYDGDEIKFTQNAPRSVSVTVDNEVYSLAFSTQSGATEQAARTDPEHVYKFTDNVKVYDKVFIITPKLEILKAHTTLTVKNPDNGITYTSKGNSKYEQKQADGSVIVSGYSNGNNDVDFDSIRTGSTITFSADCDDEHIPVWKLSDGKTYVGRVFYYTVQTPKFSFTNNVELTFEKSSYVLGGGNKDATRGKVVPQIEVFAPSGSILHQPSSSTDGSTPAEGAMVYIDGLENCVGVVDDRGKVKFHNVDADGNLSKEEV